MAGFLYYVPGEKHPLTRQRLAEIGLGYAFEGQFHGTSVENVFGAHGQLVADSLRVELGRVAWHPEQQVWQAWTTPAGHKVHVGMYRDQPPKTGELQRSKMLPGEPVEMLDGSRWIVPIARQWQPGEELVYTWELPRVAQLGEDGQSWRPGPVVLRYQPLWDLATQYYDARMAQGNFDVFAGAALALSGNYRVQAAECSLLGILGQAEALNVLDALIQWAQVEAILQKKMAHLAGSEPTPGSGSSSGPVAEQPITDRALST